MVTTRTWMRKGHAKGLSVWTTLVFAVVIALVSASPVEASHRSRAHHKESKSSRRRESRSSKRDRRGRSRREYESRGRGRHGRSGREYESRRRGRHGRHHYYYASDSPASTSAPQPSSGIPAERITEIQRALIKGAYLDGEPSGQYDSATVQAMKDFQSKNGFSATGLPSAQSLKKLGVARNSGDGYSVPINKAVDSDLRASPVPEVPSTRPGKPLPAQPKAPAAANTTKSTTDNAGTRPRVVAPAQSTGGKPPAGTAQKSDEKKPDGKLI